MYVYDIWYIYIYTYIHIYIYIPMKSPLKPSLNSSPQVFVGHSSAWPGDFGGSDWSSLGGATEGPATTGGDNGDLGKTVDFRSGRADGI